MNLQKHLSALRESAQKTTVVVIQLPDSHHFHALSNVKTEINDCFQAFLGIIKGSTCNIKITSSIVLEEVYSTVSIKMQTRSLFTVLILGLAAGIAYVQADTIADLEKLSAEQLTQVMLEVVKELYAHVDSETQLKGKLQLVAEFPQFPELKEFVDLPFNEFLDEVTQVLIEKLPEESSSETAELKKEIIAFVKELQQLEELQKLAEESDE